MSASKGRTACRLSISSLALLATLADAQDFSQLDIAAGKALFERNWVSAPASTAATDGLGPYYDARSCAACHPGGGRGAYPDSLTRAIDDPVFGRQLQRHAVAGLPAEAGAALQHAGSLRLPPALPGLPAEAGAALQHAGSLRLPPALAGVALFENVSDATLAALADPDDRNGDGISGRVSGRYGWKADASTLEQQIGRAFSLDLGLGNRWYPSAWGDCTQSQTACLQMPAGAPAGEPEVADNVLTLLQQWLRSLLPPVTAAASEPLFNQFGCNGCHVASLPLAAGELRAWTDLLRHDMGPELAADDPSADAAEWRTPPLWGAGSNTHYLHDGRAQSLEAAILLHGGEASGSRQAYEGATNLQRQRLLAFLKSL